MTNDISGLDNSAPVALQHETPFQIGSVEVRPMAREVIGAAGREVIEPRVMQVLVALARAKGEIVTRDDLIAACWEGRIVTEDAINRVIHKIRKLADRAGGFRLETITRAGYRLLTLSELGQAAPATDAPPLAAEAPRPRAKRRLLDIANPVRRRPLAAVIAALCASVLLAGGYWTWRRAVPTEPPAVAVLPFEPLYTDPDAQFYADGVASSIGNTLASVGIPVVSQTQSFQYRGAAQSQAARALDAAYIIDGDVRREGDTMRITVRVDDARRGVTLSARTFEGQTRDTAGLREQVVASTANVLAFVGVLPPELTPEVLRMAEQVRLGKNDLALFESARSLARKMPDNVFVQLTLAFETAFTLRLMPRDRRIAALSEGRAAAERALRLDPNAVDAYAALGLMTPWFLFAQREALLQRAIDVNPEAPTPYSFLADLYCAAGRVREAALLRARAISGDPLSAGKLGGYIETLAALGRRDEAASLLARAQRLFPDNPATTRARFQVAFQAGDYTEVERILRKPEMAALFERPDRPIIRPFLSARRTGTAKDRTAFLATCEDASDPFCVIGAAMLGDKDAAFRAAAQIYPDQRAPTPETLETRWLDTQAYFPAYWALFLPQMAALRADPRFIDIAERTGLLAYWRESGHAPDFCASEHAPVCTLLAH